PNRYDEREIVVGAERATAAILADVAGGPPLPSHVSAGQVDARRVSYLSRFFSMQTVTSPDAPQGVRQVVVGPERDGQRIDNALMTLLKGVPKSMIYRLLRTGQVRVNGKRAKPDTRLADGD